jgi:hypothetical protein
MNIQHTACRNLKHNTYKSGLGQHNIRHAVSERAYIHTSDMYHSCQQSHTHRTEHTSCRKLARACHESGHTCIRVAVWLLSEGCLPKKPWCVPLIRTASPNEGGGAFDFTKFCATTANCLLPVVEIKR